MKPLSEMEQERPNLETKQVNSAQFQASCWGGRVDLRVVKESRNLFGVEPKVAVVDGFVNSGTCFTKKQGSPFDIPRTHDVETLDS